MMMTETKCDLLDVFLMVKDVARILSGRRAPVYDLPIRQYRLSRNQILNSSSGISATRRAAFSCSLLIPACAAALRWETGPAPNLFPDGRPPFAPV